MSAFGVADAIRQTSALSRDTDNNKPRLYGDSSVQGYSAPPDVSTGTWAAADGRPSQPITTLVGMSALTNYTILWHGHDLD
jgi:hypothetical protein